MGKKRRVIIPNDLYIYNTGNLDKYIKISIVFSIIFFISIMIILYTYMYIPEESNSQNTINLENSKNIIATDDGVYYDGVFTSPPPKIPLGVDSLANARETLYLYLFNDNHIMLWKLYKNNDRRDFYYTSFNLGDKDINSLAIKESGKAFLDFYDNFTKARFNKNIGSFSLELPSFSNIDSALKSNLEGTLIGNFDFSFKNYYASMVNWSKNKALYIASAYGNPLGNISIPGYSILLDNASTVLSYHLVGEPPFQYSHNLTAGLVYIEYDINPIPVFIYESKPYSKNSSIIRFFYKNKWYIYDNFDIHSYEESTDYYSRESGFSFIFTQNNYRVENKSGIISHYISEVEEGIIEGYIILDKNKIAFNGVAIKEYIHSVN